MLTTSDHSISLLRRETLDTIIRYAELKNKYEENSHT